MDLGLLYLVETSQEVIGTSRLVAFWITDELRTRFLLRRDRALATLQRNSSPFPVAAVGATERVARIRRAGCAGG
jgi:hypothetical protein